MDFIIGKQLYSNLAFDGIKRVICNVSARELVNICDTWCFNREIDISHIKNIENDLKTQKYPTLLGTMKIIYNNSEYKVIDGQHRLEAIRNIIRDDVTMSWDFPLIVEIYDVNGLNKEIINYLYNKANENLNIRTEDHLDTFIMELIEKLMKHPILKTGIVDKQDGNVNRPRISKKELYDKLKKYNKTPSDTTNELCEKIAKKNREIGTMSLMELFGNTDEKSRKKLERAKSLGFFLNMTDCKIKIDDWIKEL